MLDFYNTLILLLAFLSHLGDGFALILLTYITSKFLFKLVRCRFSAFDTGHVPKQLIHLYNFYLLLNHACLCIWNIFVFDNVHLQIQEAEYKLLVVQQRILAESFDESLFLKRLMPFRF